MLLEKGSEQVKKYQSLFVIVALLFSAFGVVSSGYAQARPEREGAKNLSGKRPGPESGSSRISDIQAILRARKNGTMAPSDPCATSVTITVNVPIDDALSSGDCLLTASNTYIDFYDFQATAGEAISISEFSNAFDTYLYVLDADGNIIYENDDSAGTTDSRMPIDGGVLTVDKTGLYYIGANSYDPSVGPYTISLDTPAECAPIPIFYNQTPGSVITTSSCATNDNDLPYFTDLYTFYGVAGRQISITMASANLDSFLILHTPSGVGSLADDDSGGGLNARIPASGTFTLPETGVYTIESSTANAFETGAYTVNLTGPTTGTISGRVVTPSGAGLRNSVVSLTDSLGVRRTVTTSSFGFYSFNDVPPGPNYVIRISSRLYRFTPLTVQFNDDLTDVNFTGLE